MLLKYCLFQPLENCSFCFFPLLDYTKKFPTVLPKTLFHSTQISTCAARILALSLEVARSPSSINHSARQVRQHHFADSEATYLFTLRASQAVPLPHMRGSPAEGTMTCPRCRTLSSSFTSLAICRKDPKTVASSTNLLFPMRQYSKTARLWSLPSMSRSHYKLEMMGSSDDESQCSQRPKWRTQWQRGLSVSIL